jgi:hypothetical protein
VSAERRRLRPRDVLFGLYVSVCLLAVTWPGYAWFGNRIEPLVLGFPFSLAWIVGWVLLSLLALVLYHTSGPTEN